MSNAGDGILAALFLIFMVVCIGGCGYTVLYLPNKSGEATFQVESKERIAEGGDGKWLVFAVDGETFQITDNLFRGRFDSTDLYRRLTPGHTYRCETTGARVPLLSEYRNLIDCGEVPR